MATTQDIANRVRLELGDIGKTFVHQTIADGVTNRFLVPYSPVDAVAVLITLDGVDVSDLCEIEEHTGFLTFDEVPEAGAVILVSGTHYRYFTTAEIDTYVATAVKEHTYHATDSFGRQKTLANLPPVEEYPLIMLATTLALYTLATDAAFDIDIQAPDGVNIPRSERYRQIMEMVTLRREQYKEICQLLGIGIFRIEVLDLRRTSKMTNYLIPLYRPQEVDDPSKPQRVYVPISPQGGDPIPSTAGQSDLVFTQGDTFSAVVDFPGSLAGYTPKAQIRSYPESALVFAEFTCTITDAEAGLMEVSLTSSQTARVPLRSFWDLQLTSDSGDVHTYVRGSVFCERQVTR